MLTNNFKPRLIVLALTIGWCIYQVYIIRRWQKINILFHYSLPFDSYLLQFGQVTIDKCLLMKEFLSKCRIWFNLSSMSIGFAALCRVFARPIGATPVWVEGCRQVWKKHLRNAKNAATSFQMTVILQNEEKHFDLSGSDISLWMDHLILSPRDGACLLHL